MGKFLAQKKWRTWQAAVGVEMVGVFHVVFPNSAIARTVLTIIVGVLKEHAYTMSGEKLEEWRFFVCQSVSKKIRNTLT